MDMCSGPILSKMIIFAVPLIFSGFLQLMFNAADIIVVGKFGSEHSLAAVGATASLVNLLVNIFLGLSVGANTIVARRYGAGDLTGVKKAVHTSVYLGIISGILLMILGLIFTQPLLAIMKTPKDIINLSALYLRIYFIGAPFSMFFNFGSAVLRAVGDTRRPLYFLTVSGIVNVILNLILVIVFNLDVAGVAIATVVSQVISAVLMFIALLKHTGAIRLYPKEIKFHKIEFIQIIQIGIPSGIQSCVFSFSNMVVQSSINYLGTKVIAACSAASSIEGFVYVGMNSFYQAVLSFVSQNFGKRDFSRIKKIIIDAIILVTVTGISLGLLVMCFHKPLLRLYMSDPNDSQMLSYGFQRLSIVAIPYFLCGIMDILAGSLRGMGQSFIPMISTLFGVCGGRLLWIFTVFDRFKDTTGVIWFGIELTPLQILMFAWPVAWTATGILHFSVLIYTYRKNVKKMKSVNNIKVINRAEDYNNANLNISDKEDSATGAYEK